jgi:LA2681-like HEPN
LRGLFWLSKDLYEDKSGFHEAIEPDAQELATLRNHLEHKYLRVHEYRLPPHLRPNQLLSPPTDSFSHSVGRRDFEAKTLRLLKTLRAALIYLSLAVYTEERFRSQERDPNQTIPVLPAHPLKDDLKVSARYRRNNNEG